MCQQVAKRGYNLICYSRRVTKFRPVAPAALSCHAVYLLPNISTLCPAPLHAPLLTPYLLLHSWFKYNLKTVKELSSLLKP